MTIDDDTEIDLDESQEVCPICGQVICPGAVQYCDHYLWTRWDGQVIWEIAAASHLTKVASELMDYLFEVDEEGWLQEALDQATGQYGNLVALVRDVGAVSDEDLILPEEVVVGQRRETDGMLSGSGHSVFYLNSAKEWARSRAEQLRNFHHFIEARKPLPPIVQPGATVQRDTED